MYRDKFCSHVYKSPIYSDPQDPARAMTSVDWNARVGDVVIQECLDDADPTTLWVITDCISSHPEPEKCWVHVKLLHSTSTGYKPIVKNLVAV